MAQVTRDNDGIEQFDPHAPNVAERWKRWMKSWQYFIDSEDEIEDKKKRSKLLHKAGQAVQTIYDTLVDKDKTYDSTMAALNEHFTPKENTWFQRYLFWQIRQQEAETTDAWVARLRIALKTCEFGDKEDDAMISQIINFGNNKRLRRRIFQSEDVTLKWVLSTARALETSETRACTIETNAGPLAQSEAINALRNTKQSWTPASRRFEGHRPPSRRGGTNQGAKPSDDADSNKQLACWRCGDENHIARGCTRAIGKTCSHCGKIGHFAKVCRQRKESESQNRTAVRALVEEPPSTNDSDSDDAFGVSSGRSRRNRAMVKMNGVGISMTVDTGATVTVINRDQWNTIQKTGTKLRPTSKRVFRFDSSTPLEFAGQFNATIQCAPNEARATVLVVNSDAPAILGQDVAEELQLVTLDKDRVFQVKEKYPKELCGLEDVFVGSGKLKNYRCKLHIDKTVSPVAQKNRRIPFHMRAAVENEIKRLEDGDIIERVTGPTTWLSPGLSVPKPNGKIRHCVDMRMANQAILREKLQLPTADDILNEMDGATVISELDLKEGYHQIELEEQSRDVTTFSTHTGNYRYKRLMFGVTSAPEIFQKLIADTISGIDGVRNISDNIIIYGRSEEEHNGRLRQAVERVRDAGLKLNLEKCQFGLSQLDFMGHTVTGKGMMPSQKKIKAITGARIPNDASELRSFLGLINFCGRYISQLSSRTAHMRKLLRQDIEWAWTDTEDNEFVDLKKAITERPVLAYFDKTARTRVVVDASPVGIGAVVLQAKVGAEEFRPVIYVSRGLTDVEQRYCQTEKEALAVVWGIERCRLYLLGSEFELETDHKPLEVIYGPRSKPSARIERWMLRLMPYSFKVVYRPGRTNIADPLSRIGATRIPKGPQNEGQEYIHFLQKFAKPKAVKWEEVIEESRRDTTIARVAASLRSGKWEKADDGWKRMECELAENEGVLMRGTRIVIPTEMRKRMLQIAHETHQGVVRTKQLLRAKVWWKGMDKDVESMIKECETCQQTETQVRKSLITTSEIPSGPWKKIAIDICGPVPSGEYIIVIVDYYSRWPAAKITKNITATSIIRWLRSVFATWGFPEVIRSDNGPQFIAAEFESFLEECGIKHEKSIPYWPQANGMVERLNKVFMKAVRSARCDGKEWTQELLTFLQTYRSTPHRMTGKSPAQMMFGREMRTKLPEVHRPSCAKEDSRRADKKNKGKMIDDANRKRRAQNTSVSINDIVRVTNVGKRDKFTTEFSAEKFTVVGVEGKEIKIKSTSGKIYSRCIDQVKVVPTTSDDVPTESSDSDDDCFPEANIREQPIDIKGPVEGPNDETERPRRLRGPPTHLKDYVCTQHT